MQANSDKRSKSIKKHIFVYSMLGLAILNFLVFYVYANGSAFVLPFLSEDTNRFTLENFRNVFADIAVPGSRLLIALRNTLIYYFVNLLVILPFSLFGAYFIMKKILGHKFFTVIFMIPMIVSTVVLVAVYKNMLGAGGPISVLYELFGKEAPFFLYQEETATLMIVIFSVWTGFGLQLIMFSGAMSRIPDSVQEYGRLEGIGFMQELWTVVLPMVWPTFSTILMLSSIGMFSASGPVLLFSDGLYNTQTISFEIYSTTVVSGKFNYAAAFGLLLTVASLPMFFLITYLRNRVPSDVEY